VFDALGREVTTLVDRIEGAGRQSAMFDGSGTGSGVYFYRLQAGTYTETKKFMVLH
jgi:hypothetical protein